MISFFAALLILTVVGPFGTYDDLPFASRLVYWVVILFGVGLFMNIAIIAALSMSVLNALPKSVRIGLGVVLAAVPGAAVVAFIDAFFRGSSIESAGLFRLWWQVCVIGAIIGAVEFRDWEVTRRSSVPLPAKGQGAIMQRIPAEARGKLISMSSQDHYLEIVTDAGSALILMRLSDALREIEGIDGMRVHRSHWVAFSHMQSIEKDGNRHMLTLNDGRKLPVSQTYLKEARARLSGP